MRLVEVKSYEQVALDYIFFLWEEKNPPNSHFYASHVFVSGSLIDLDELKQISTHEIVR